MPDEVATEAPAESAEPSSPTEPTEPTEAEPVVEAPTYVTAEDLQSALDNRDASQRSWMGRSDKETLNHI
jgi:hypothetical protein